jgi:2-hydroxychromene-2-carboxylate isomerase
MATVEFWFEFASTYSYLSALRIEGLAARSSVRVLYKPFLLGPIFAEQGMNDSPFNIYPLKGRYMWRDLERLCASHNLPFKKPTQFPRNGLLAARIALMGVEEAWGPAFVRAVYGANFADDRDIGSEEVLASLLTRLGLESAHWLSLAQAPATKARLRAQTEEARERGIFGAPSFVADGELFWGNDRLEHALAWASRSAH